MADTPYVFDASADNFPRLVLENSDKGPVLVNYWSPRAGPCMMLMPRLLRLAKEFSGRFLLVMLNTDEFGPLARSHGVVSLPTVKVFRHGKVADTLHGAESEDTVREFIRKHLADPSAIRLKNTLAVHAGFLLAAKDAPPREKLIESIAADPDNLEARYQLSAVHLVADEYEPAMEQLLEIARHDSAFRNDAGRTGLLALFELLGEEDERVRRYRELLQASLH